RANHHLARYAPPVRALAPDQTVFDTDDAESRLSQCSGGRLAADTQPQHHDVDLLCHDHTVALVRVTGAPNAPASSTVDDGDVVHVTRSYAKDHIDQCASRPPKN